MKKYDPARSLGQVAAMASELEVTQVFRNYEGLP
jgi:hypothetical protein